MVILSYGAKSDDAEWAGVASYLRREREKMEAEEVNPFCDCDVDDLIVLEGEE